MSRWIDADKLNVDFYDEYETEDDAYAYGYVSIYQVDTAPTIKTKQIKYYDEDEQVWKVGEVIVSDSEKPNNCEDEPNCEECKHFNEESLTYMKQCKYYFMECKFEPKDEPQTEDKCKGCIYENEDSLMACVSCQGKVPYDGYEWDEPQTDTEIAKAIVHKMIDDAVIAEDAYPNLRQKMHDAVDEYEPQTERSE